MTCTSNKITKPFFNILYPLFIFCLLTYSNLYAQNPSITIIRSYKHYKQQVKDDSLRQMVELHAVIPSLIYDLRYTTTQNFTGHKLYPNTKTTFMRKPAGAALKKVQEELAKKGLGLKIFDAYRPYAATVKMWNLIKDDRYVADPKKGSGHNRGLAVDLTIIKQENGEELNMGTGFDNFTDTAHHSFQDLPEIVLQNRRLLKTIMEKNGFKSIESEWWHYYWPNDRNYDVMDISFRVFLKK